MPARIFEVHPSQFGVTLHDLGIAKVIHPSVQIVQVLDVAVMLELLVKILIAIHIQRQITILMNDIGDTVFRVVLKMQLCQINFAVRFLDLGLELRIVAQQLFHVIPVANVLWFLARLRNSRWLELLEMLIQILIPIVARSLVA